ncbi:hypothetical protein MRX96_017905 [Rhipicephalus microplus]
MAISTALSTFPISRQYAKTSVQNYRRVRATHGDTRGIAAFISGRDEAGPISAREAAASVSPLRPERPIEAGNQARMYGRTRNYCFCRSISKVLRAAVPIGRASSERSDGVRYTTRGRYIVCIA